MHSEPLETCEIGPLRVARTTFGDAARHIRAQMRQGRQVRLAFCNSHTAAIAFRDPSFRRDLAQMLVVNDGVGLDVASHLLTGERFPENLNGTDFIPRFLGEETERKRIFLLGAKPHIVAEAERRFAAAYPHHDFVGHHHGFFGPDERAAILHRINSAGPDILLVAMGNPAQERFIVENGESLNCRLIAGVGALFDFTAGQAVRAPALIQRLKMEWLFRLAQEPRRLLWRYTGETALFLGTILALRLGLRMRSA